MAVLSLLEVPKLKELVRPYGYVLHLHDACGGQSFTLEPVGDDLSGEVYGAIERFFAQYRMSVEFYDVEKLHFVVR